MDTLFDEPSQFDRDELAARLKALAARHIYIGGSSWKYEGWLGQIYSRSRYLTRGRFSQKLFNDTCLQEYAQTFPTVCGDFAFKAPEQVTCKVFPGHARYGAQAGIENESFLDADLLKESFLRPLEPYRDRTALVILEFGSFSRKTFFDAGEFLEKLDPFLAKLPGEYRYAVEIRNPDFLERQYFRCLRDHKVAHVFNAWSRMPELRHQMALPDSFTADFIVSRALLRQSRSYEDAVQLFTPYTEIKDQNPEVRASLRDIVRIAQDKQMTAFLFVNNRLEGNAPATIMAITEP